MIDQINKGILFAQISTTLIPTADIGINTPSFQSIMSFAIRGLFLVAGLVSLFFLLLGALGYITSGGDKDSTEKARSKILNAAIGLILVFVVLGVASLLEQVTGVGMGITQPIKLPKLAP